MNIILLEDVNIGGTFYKKGLTVNENDPNYPVLRGIMNIIEKDNTDKTVKWEAVK